MVDAAEDEEDMYCLKFFDKAPRAPPRPTPPPPPPPPPLAAAIAIAFLHSVVRLAASRASRAGEDIERTTSSGSPATPSSSEMAALISMPRILDTNFVRTAGCRSTGRHAISWTSAVNDLSLSPPPPPPAPPRPPAFLLYFVFPPPRKRAAVLASKTAEAVVDDVEDQFDTRIEMSALTYAISQMVAAVTDADCPTPVVVLLVDIIAGLFVPCGDDDDDARMLSDAAVSE